MNIESFVFNIARENTYVLFNEKKECVIIDPGCASVAEQNTLNHFIEKNNLHPILLLLTHGHFDHVLGLTFVAEKYNLIPFLNQKDKDLVDNLLQSTDAWGLQNVQAYKGKFLEVTEQTKILFDNKSIQIFETPGHSPGSVSYLFDEKTLLVGDVLFRESVGRTDLPMSNFEDLKKSIQTKIYTLNDNIMVYPGHGFPTNIKHEKVYNPFINAM